MGEKVQDHCRIGSLEIFMNPPKLNLEDHCRIGSLENGHP